MFRALKKRSALSKRSALTFNFLACGLALFVWISCSSKDLGNEKPLELKVNAAAPTWGNGVQDILKAKCDNCHSSNPSRFVPGQAKAYVYDFATAEATFLANHAARTKARVFDTPTRPMPPDFATPLTSDERAAIEKYLAEKLATSVFAGCPTTTALTFADVKTISDISCKVCHSAGATPRVPLTSAAEFKAQRTQVLALIKQGRMPPDNPTFKNSADGQKMVEWLCAGSDVQ